MQFTIVKSYFVLQVQLDKCAYVYYSLKKIYPILNLDLLTDNNQFEGLFTSNLIPMYKAFQSKYSNFLLQCTYLL